MLVVVNFRTVRYGVTGRAFSAGFSSAKASLTTRFFDDIRNAVRGML
jgi:hypothetical protein